MKVTKQVSSGTLTVLIDGRIDTITAPILERELNNSVTNDINCLIFDFEKVEYMASAGIRVIMVADKVMSKLGEMKLIHVSEEVFDIFDITGLADLLTIE